MSVDAQAKCGGCGATLDPNTQVLVRRTWIGLREEINLVHRRARGPRRALGDCGPVIVVGPEEGRVALDRPPVTLTRQMTAKHRRRLAAERRRAQIRAILHQIPPRKAGAPPWEFGGEGIDFRAAVATFERALIERALMLCQGHHFEAARLLRMPPKTLRSRRASMAQRDAARRRAADESKGATGCGA